jgi:hypothetical protein
MTRSRSLVSENIEGLFGLTEILIFPGPVRLMDADKRDLPCSGIVTFQVKIVERMTSITAWVTDALGGGQLVIGAGPMEDLGLLVSEVPDNTNPRGHALETRTVSVPGSAQTRSARAMTHPKSATQLQPCEQNIVNGEENYLAPLQAGFLREVVFDSKGEQMNIYYVAPNGKTKVASPPAMERYLKENPALGLSMDNFCWQKIIMGLERETVRTAKTRHSSARSTPQMGTPPQLALSDDATPMAATKNIYHTKLGDLPSNHWAPTIKM